jgi:hypothetical protein
MAKKAVLIINSSDNDHRNHENKSWVIPVFCAKVEKYKFNCELLDSFKNIELRAERQLGHY